MTQTTVRCVACGRIIRPGTARVGKMLFRGKRIIRMAVAHVRCQHKDIRVWRDSTSTRMAAEEQMAMELAAANRGRGTKHPLVRLEDSGTPGPVVPGSVPGESKSENSPPSKA
jgi:hypothetical protein